MKKHITIALLTVFLSISLNAQWQVCNGPYISNDIREMVSDGTNIFAATGNGIFRSTDNGTSWTECNNGLPYFDVWAIHLSGSVLFASIFHIGTYSGIYVSTDYGNTWVATENEFTPGDVPISIKSIGSNIFTAVQNEGVYHSTDNGVNWTMVNNGLPTLNVTELAINSNRVFVSTGGSGVYYSTNNGGLWNSCNSGIAGTDQTVTHIHASDSLLFCSTYNGFGPAGIYVSEDNGSNWDLRNTGITNLYGNDFVVSGSSVFFATTMGGVFYSNDLGNQWHTFNDGLTSPCIHSLCINGSNIFAGNGQNEGTVFRRSIFDVGIEENNIVSLQTYPNPTTELIHIEATFDEFDLIVTNAIGQVVHTMSGMAKNGQITISLLDKPRGIYYVRLKNKFGVGLSKIILQ
jgi:photosystem II stability/assembly factor-like uncharacterized protein